MPIVVVCEPHPPFQAGPQQETLSPLEREEHLGASATSKRGSPKKGKGYQDGQVSLIQKPVWLVLEKEGAVTQNQGWYSMLLKKDRVGGLMNGKS